MAQSCMICWIQMYHDRDRKAHLWQQVRQTLRIASEYFPFVILGAVVRTLLDKAITFTVFLSCTHHVVHVLLVPCLIAAAVIVETACDILKEKESTPAKNQLKHFASCIFSLCFPLQCFLGGSNPVIKIYPFYFLYSVID